MSELVRVPILYRMITILPDQEIMFCLLKVLFITVLFFAGWKIR